MRKVWIFMGILFIIIFGVALGCALSPDIFRPWLVASMASIFGTAAITVNDTWTNISADPVYQQWHMLIWFAGGIIGTIIFTKILWPRRPRLFQPKQVITKDYQHEVEPKLPQTIVEAVPENIAKPASTAEPQKEEAVAK